MCKTISALLDDDRSMVRLLFHDKSQTKAERGNEENNYTEHDLSFAEMFHANILSQADYEKIKS